jgi:hypothetical protein
MSNLLEGVSLGGGFMSLSLDRGRIPLNPKRKS